MDKPALRLLAIEDDDGDAELLRRKLLAIDEWQFDFIHVSDLDAAWREYANGNIDVTVLDFFLGKESALEFLGKLRETGHIGSVIVVTGQGDERVAVSLMRSGADDYLTKESLNSDSLCRSIRHARSCYARRAAEEELRQKNTQLEILLEQAKAATVAKTQFLANVSHEIRTPMTAIIGFVELLEESVDGSGACEILDTIHQNSQYLLELINDMLDVSKIEAGKLQCEHIAFSPKSLMDDVTSLMRPRATKRGLSLEVHYTSVMPAMILSDPTRLRQVLINLIGNAIKFTETGSILVLVGVDDGGKADESDSFSASDSMIHFVVADSGIGMSPEQMEKIFQPFTQADSSTSRRFGGTGLGLTISQNIVSLLGGNIEIHSDPGRGSIFRASIPTGPIDQTNVDSQPEPSGVRATEKRTSFEIDRPCQILLAEDYPDNQRLIAHVLKKAGTDVSIAGNGQEAVDAVLEAQANGTPFDIVLMDMQMPVMDGLEATRQLRAKGLNLPIVALTANAMTSDRQKFYDAGCDAFLAKPIDWRELAATIDKFLPTPA